MVPGELEAVRPPPPGGIMCIAMTLVDVIRPAYWILVHPRLPDGDAT